MSSDELLAQFEKSMQISAGVPFKADLAFLSGADLKSLRVDDRVSSLTGVFFIDDLRYQLSSSMLSVKILPV